MSLRHGWAAALCLLVLGVASSASAHLMSRGHGTLNVFEGKAYIVISLPIAVFAQSDAASAVQDGVLTSAELKANEAALRASIRAGLQVKAGPQDATFSSILLNLPEGADHTPGQGADLVVMIVAQLGADPQAIAVSSTLWAKGAETLKLKATVTEGRRTTQTEVFDLTAKAPAHVFFAKKAATKKAARKKAAKKKPVQKAKAKTHSHGRSKPHSH